jgi:hypothetical protein
VPRPSGPRPYQLDRGALPDDGAVPLTGQVRLPTVWTPDPSGPLGHPDRRNETFQIYNVRNWAGLAVGTVCLLATAVVAGWCGVIVGALWIQYIEPWISYAANHYHQCLYM